jgi:hypothetical protein
MDTLTAMMAELRGELPSTPRIDVHTLSRPKSNYKHSIEPKRQES